LLQSIRDIFEHNIRLLGGMDKAIYYFREQQCDKALGQMANSMDEVRLIIEAIITDREYFNLVDTESMLEMLTGILEAKKNKDFVLLADLLELQLINFLIGVQELIISKEEIVFDEEIYRDNIQLLLEHSEGFEGCLHEPLNTAHLLESGYRIEFTSSGLMTLAAENQGSTFYFHTNNKIRTEAFLLARQWYSPEKRIYHIYGYGLGYHINELHELTPDADIVIYEADINVIRLACAFTGKKGLILNDKIKVIYDPEFTLLSERLKVREEAEALCIHYPSYKNVRSRKGREALEAGFPWLGALELI
jgi:hypothetical protein